MAAQLPRLARVLVTNDDGIDAPGLAVAAEVAARIGREVWVVAPERDCSGAGARVTLNDPVRMRRLGARRFAVAGTPGDCVGVALNHLVEGPVDLVISGVNSGANTAIEIGFSGTFGAALTAHASGVPAIALSQAWISREDVPWDTARAVMPGLVERILADGGWRGESVLNINTPPVPPEAVRGYELTRPCPDMRVTIEADRRTDRRGGDYFWLGFAHKSGEPAADSDVAALRRGAVSITPVAGHRADAAAFGNLAPALAPAAD